MDRLSNNYRKGASFDAPFRAASLLADRALLAVLLGSICVFVLWPMVCIALRSFQDSGGGFTLDQYRTVWSSYGRSLGNSLFVGALTAFFCTVLSVAVALVLATSRGWARALLMGVLLITMVSPPFVSSLAYIQLYGLDHLPAAGPALVPLQPVGRHLDAVNLLRPPQRHVFTGHPL